MSQLWLMTIAALLAVNVIAQDKSNQDDNDKRFLNLVRRKACVGRSCGGNADDDAKEIDLSDEGAGEIDYSSQHADDVKLGEKNIEDSSVRRKRGCLAWHCRKRTIDPRKRTSNRAKYIKRQQMESPAPSQFRTGQDKKINNKGEDFAFRACRTFSCKLRKLLESEKEDRQEGIENHEDRSPDNEAEKRCMSWKCKKRSLIREKLLSKKNKVTDEKRCMSWSCRKRSQITSLQNNGGTEQEDLQERRDVMSKKEVKNRDEVTPENVERKASVRRCMAWKCHGKRSAAKRVESEALDFSKRIIGRKQDEDLDWLTLLRNGKCRGLECLTKRTRELNNPETAAITAKKEDTPGCMSWNCYGKRMVSKKGSTMMDTSKRIISRKKDKDLDFPGLSDNKCRGWECLRKRLVLGVKQDMPTKCLSWDCDKRKADTGESTSEKRPQTSKTHDETTPHIKRRDQPQYGITDEYKDAIEMPIRRDAMGRNLPYFTETDLPRSLLQGDFQEGGMAKEEREDKPQD